MPDNHPRIKEINSIVDRYKRYELYLQYYKQRQQNYWKDSKPVVKLIESPIVVYTDYANGLHTFIKSKFLDENY